MVRSLVVGCLVAAAGASACAWQPRVGGEPRGVDRKLSTFAYIEEGSLLSLIVGTQAARYREDAEFLPLEIAIANRGLRQLAIHRESLTLVDAEGRRYPMATPRELIEGYGFLDFDRQYAELAGITFNRFVNFHQYASNFSPVRGSSSRSTLVLDRVVLPRFGYLIDFVYFPKPPGGIVDRTFELFLDSPDLEEPAFIRFEVR